jgi:hypothetical protein
VSWKLKKPRSPNLRLACALNKPSIREGSITVTGPLRASWPSVEGLGSPRTAARSAGERRERRYRWGGFTAVPDGTVAVRLEFPPVALRALRRVLPAGDPVYDWSIPELAVETD